MTLARRHFQRLWFPLPGGGCDIPSRSEFSLTAEQFNQYMPQEFWREVVERVSEEAPDTLLLAEGFLADGKLFCAHAGHAPCL